MIRTALAALPVMVVTSSCVVISDYPEPAGEPVTRFTRVVHSSSSAIKVRPGPRHRVSLDCDEGFLREVDVTPVNGVLRIDSRMTDGCALTVEAPWLRSVENESLGDVEIAGGLRVEDILNSGSGDVLVRSVEADDVFLSNTSLGSITVERVETESLTVVNDGSGDVFIDSVLATFARVENFSLGDVIITGVDVAELSVENSGSGTMFLQGFADVQTVGLRSLGDVDSDVSSRIADVITDGSGDATVTAWQRADVTIYSIGDVLVRGQPQALVVRGDGSGTVYVEQ